MKPAATFAIVGLLSATFAGCASYPDKVAELDDARERIVEVQKTVTSNPAKQKLIEARGALQHAMDLHATRGDLAQVREFSLEAYRLADIAEERQFEANAMEAKDDADVETGRPMYSAEGGFDNPSGSPNSGVSDTDSLPTVSRTERVSEVATSAQRRISDAVAVETDNLIKKISHPQFANVGSETVLMFKDVFFDSDTTSLKPDSAAALDGIAVFLRNEPNRTLRIEGHMDSNGNSDISLAISEARANRVRKELVARGISSDRIRSIGKGERYPLVSNNTEAGRQLNRRVEIVISAASGSRRARLMGYSTE